MGVDFTIDTHFLLGQLDHFFHFVEPVPRNEGSTPQGSSFLWALPVRRDAKRNDAAA